MSFELPSREQELASEDRHITPSPKDSVISLKHTPLTDSRIDDTVQEDARIEWYYLNGHLREDGHTVSGTEEPRYSFIACVFRLHNEKAKEGESRHSWCVLFSRLDWKTKQYKTSSKVTPEMRGFILSAVENAHDSLFTRTLKAMLQKPDSEFADGVSPFAPDVIFTELPQIHKAETALHIEWDGNAVISGEDGRYTLQIPEFDVDLKFESRKPLLLHGHGGETLVGDQKGKMFYYSWPRMHVVGTVEGTTVTGTGWYDHEYSLESAKPAVESKGPVAEGGNPDSYGWNWFSLQSDGSADQVEISITQVLDVDSAVDTYVVWLDEDGVQRTIHDFDLVKTRSWISAQTFRQYDTAWRLSIPEHNCELEITAVADDQEFCTWIKLPSFYEGAIRFSGTWKGKSVKGVGMVELVFPTNSAQTDKFVDKLLKNAGLLGRELAIATVPPSVQKGHFEEITGVSFTEPEEEIIQTDIVDAFHMLNGRGGKNWRPMLCAASIGAVGADANQWRTMLVIPELVHTGSLVIDDIQDESDSRRGGPTVHKALGVAKAINAGCAMYFWGEAILAGYKHVSNETVRAIYELYFRMLRVGHAGQALDIAGITLDKLPTMEESTALLDRIINLHRCKTGVPAALAGTMGAILGGGSPEQVEVLGSYIEDLGIAFQIRDDVLDVLGEVKGKNAADDLHNHKVTYPVAALFALDHPDRSKWFDSWAAHDVPAMVEALKSSGTMERCIEEVTRYTERLWERVDRMLPDSFSKLMLRMFAQFLTLDEHSTKTQPKDIIKDVMF